MDLSEEGIKEDSEVTIIEVWGISSRHGATRDAARGALTWKRYDSLEAMKQSMANMDWLNIIAVIRRPWVHGQEGKAKWTKS
jgi:hypothetical protein